MPTGSRARKPCHSTSSPAPRGDTLAPTELARLLVARGIRRVVVCGLATDYCVRATALDALALGYPPSVLVEGVRAVDLHAGDGASALRGLAEAGVELVQPAIAAAVEGVS